MSSATRRSLLKTLGAGGAALTWPALGRTQDAAPGDAPATPRPADTVSFADAHDRVFLHGDCWANPMEDWVVKDGMAECTTRAVNRNIHRITHQLTDPSGGLEMSVVLSRAELRQADLGAGFRVGIRSELDEYRSNCFARSGVDAGVRAGTLFIGQTSQPFDGLDDPQNLKLTLAGRGRGDSFELKLTASDAGGKELGAVEATVPAAQMLGNVALVSSFGRDTKPAGANGGGRGSRYRFNDWTVAGDAFTVTPERRFGPLLWSMYSLSDSRGDDGFVLKMSALTGPLGARDNHEVEFFAQQNGEWKPLGTATLDTDAWVATVRVPKWDASADTPYKVVYQEQGRSGETTEHEWTGTVQANPSGRPLRMGALTCQNDYGFPYAPVAENLRRLKPDLLYFSGDQIYESHGGYGLIRRPAEPAILNYLRKYYMHGWSFREAMRDAPTLCLPDDHDVFQGNVWGEAGAPMDVSDGGASSKGGYIEPARMVNAVHQSTVAHHPDAFDPAPVQQDISVYYGDMVYGGVSFAVVADRQWKSGPERVDTGSGRADHVADPDFDTSVLDKPGLVLLGERQEAFLKEWAEDWRGCSMKVLLSQTVFAGVATHHGDYDGYLKADLDSGAWPQTPRDRAITIARAAKPLHINGDQHLTTLVQYGVDKQRDGFWSFCTPAISAGYPRWWRPDEVGMPHENRPAHGIPNTGEYTDGFGNLAFVYAVGNPEVASKKNRYERAHEKGSGFGLVTIDTEAKTYRIESFRFLVDATDGQPSNQFPGWPVTLHQAENAGENRL
ncbi:alkaline phosphatase D family protein [Alienimonas californiensis]|uniref:PhoD-like phosphatase n=1 Tax=Alienimonas californiensis TaxID=2527989 RepID=A0A517P554_9PLAN|nr:alkaline phosphatase D family protein [Alienimonas californiensis]QDT14475.1 PhoD-like phosphatase [Alienimonas californiensis]